MAVFPEMVNEFVEVPVWKDYSQHTIGIHCSTTHILMALLEDYMLKRSLGEYYAEGKA